MLDGFTLTGIAYPVAPSNLDGFTIQGFQWFDAPEPTDVLPSPGGTFRRPVWSWKRTWRYHPVPNEIPLDTRVGIVGEDRDYAFDFSKAPELKTGSGITIASVGVLHVALDGLTVGTPAVLAAEFDGIPIGKGVSVRVSGFEDDVTYPIACLVTLSNGRKLVAPGRLVGVADLELAGI